MRDALAYPIPISDRITLIYLERTSLERDGHTLVSVSGASKTVIPVGKTAVLMLGPGTTVSQAAVSLCALEGTLLLWVGEGGVRMYAAATGRGKPDATLRQAALFLDPEKRLRVARQIFKKMFEVDAPARRSIEQLRGIEGARVKEIYQALSKQYGIAWSGRSEDLSIPINLAISTATAALYGLCEAAILALGFNSAIGFVHSGNPRSFVFDVSDIVKFKTVVPLAFQTVAESSIDIERRVRTACRDLFVKEKMGELLVSIIDELMYANDTH